MKQYSFGTFLVDDANRAAYELCLDVANLKDCEPMPVLLLGDQGCGKTHLLYSIVNRVRAASSDTGIAYITARNFHPRVRALVNDPVPVQHAQNAVLLVDQLESFQEHLDDLEAIVRLFLDYGHPVVFATDVHPGRLRQLPDGLRAMIDTGRLIEIVHGETEACPGAAMDEAQTIIRGLQGEIAALREQLDSATRRADAAGAAAQAAHEDAEHLNAEMALLKVAAKEAQQLRAALDSAQRDLELLKAKRDAERAEASRPVRLQEMEALRAQLSIAQNSAEKAKGELEDLRHAMQEHEEETASLERLRVELAEARRAAEEAQARLAETRGTPQSVTVMAAEIEALRSALVTMSDENALAQQELRRLNGLAAGAEPAMAALRCELDAARRGQAEARAEADELLTRAEALFSEIEAGRALFARTQDEQRDQIRQLEALLAESAAGGGREELDALRAEMEALRTQLERAQQDYRTLEQTHAATVARLEKSVLEAVCGQEALQEERDRLARELAEARVALDEHTAKAASSVSREEFEIARAKAQEAWIRVERANEERRAIEQTHARSMALLEKKLQEALAAQQAIDTERERSVRELADVLAERNALQAEARRLAAQVREHDTLQAAQRKDFSERLTEARAEAREAEHRLARLQADLGFARDSGQYVGGELNSVRRRLLETAELAETLSKRLAASMGPGAAAEPKLGKTAFARSDDASDLARLAGVEDEDNVQFPAGFAVAGDGDDDLLDLARSDFDAGFDLGQFEVSPQDFDRLAQPFTPLNPRDLEVPSSTADRSREYRPLREQA